MPHLIPVSIRKDITQEIGEEPSDVDGQQIEGEKTLNWEAAKADKRRDQQRVADL